MVWSQSAGSYDGVDVGMMLQALIPGVQHAEEADLCAKMPGIASELKQSLSAGLEQKAVDQLLVLKSERRQFTRQGKDDMDVGCRQQFALPRIEPALARVALALRTVAVTTRVV